MAVNLTSLNTSPTELAARIGLTSDALALNIARLSSGNRIVRAGDDVAGASVATHLTTRVMALRSVSLNASQSISLLQVADGALTQVGIALQRMLALTSQASSSSLSTQERAYLDIEFQNLSQEIDRILKETNFNGRSLFRDTGTLTASEALFTPVNIGNAVLWYDASDESAVQLTYSTDGVATTASGKEGSNTIITAVDVSAAL